MEGEANAKRRELWAGWSTTNKERSVHAVHNYTAVRADVVRFLYCVKTRRRRLDATPGESIASYWVLVRPRGWCIFNALWSFHANTVAKTIFSLLFFHRCAARERSGATVKRTRCTRARIEYELYNLNLQNSQISGSFCWSFLRVFWCNVDRNSNWKLQA